MTENVSAASTAAEPKRETWGGKGLNVAIIVAAVLTVAGIACWAMQLSGGMVQTGMRNLDSWGLYITNFMFFVGLSAGGLIISSVPNAFGIKGFGGISKVAIWTSVCCTCAAIGFVVVDLGGPARLWELFVYSNFSSPLMWDILVLGTYLVLSVIYLWAYLRAEAGRMSHTAIRAISVVALIVAILVHNVTAWIFSLAPAHEFWHTALMGPWFVASALDCGTALVLIVCLALRRAGYLALDQGHVANLAKMLAVFVLVDLYFYACDLLTSGYFGGEGAEVVAMLTSGALSPVFWTQIALMAVSVAILVVPKLRTTPASSWRPSSRSSACSASACRFSWAASRFRTWICQALPRSMPLPTGRPGLPAPTRAWSMLRSRSNSASRSACSPCAFCSCCWG